MDVAHGKKADCMSAKQKTSRQITSAASDLDAVASEPLQRLSKAAQQAGFQCLSKLWKGWQTSYAFRCAQGHECTRSATSVVFHSIMCKECLAQQRFERLQLAAKAKGGTCLEETYLGIDVPHRFVCAHGHQWKVRASNILHGSWCQRCAQILHSERMRDPDGLARLLASPV